MKNIKYRQRITEEQIEKIVLQKYPDKVCTKCMRQGIYAGCLETQFDDYTEEDIMLSFQIFCNKCGQVLDTWDNTFRKGLF